MAPSIAAAVRQSVTENASAAYTRARSRGCCTTVKDNKLNDTFVYLRTPIRILGGITVLFSILEFGVGGFCYGFLVSPNFVGAGAFWAGLTYFILGVLCLWLRTKAVAIAALIMSIIAWVIGLGGVGLDGSVSTIVNNSLACSQMITGVGFGPKYTDYGYPKAYTGADVCFFKSYPTVQNNNCYCSTTVLPAYDIDAKAKCYTLQLSPSAANCGDIFTKYGPALKASAGLCAFLTFISFFLIILLSVSMCCERRGGEVEGGGVQINREDKSDKVEEGVENPNPAAP